MRWFGIWAGSSVRAGGGWRARIARVVRAMVVANLALLCVILIGAYAAHRWVTASEDNLESAVGMATRYVLTPASMIEEHGIPPQSLDALVQFIERVVIDGASLGPDRPIHRYWQGRVLMAMPAVYKRLGRHEERLDRGRRAIGIFEALAAEGPANTDYRRRLAVMHDFHAFALADLKRHDEALRHWQSQYDIAEGLLREQPGHWRWLWYQSGASMNTGASLIALGRPDEARPRIEAALALSARMCVEHTGEQQASMCKIAGRSGRLLESLRTRSG